jgi:hypothetical protein
VVPEVPSHPQTLAVPQGPGYTCSSKHQKFKNKLLITNLQFSYYSLYLPLNIARL